MGLGVKSFQCQVKSFGAQPLVMYVSVIFNSYCIILIDYLFLGIFLVHLSSFKGEYSAVRYDLKFRISNTNFLLNPRREGTILVRIIQ